MPKKQDFAWFRDNIVNLIDDNPIRREHVIFLGTNFVTAGIGLETSHATACTIKKIIADICLSCIGSAAGIVYKVIVTWIKKEINDVTDYTTQYLGSDDELNDIMGQKSLTILATSAATSNTTNIPVEFEINAQRKITGKDQLVMYIEWFTNGGTAPAAGASLQYNVNYSVGITRDL